MGRINLWLWLAAAVVIAVLLAIDLNDPGLLSPRPSSKAPPASARHGRRVHHAHHTRHTRRARRFERGRHKGFPDAADTGVRPGARLRTVPGQVSRGPGWAYDRRGWVRVYGDGAVLSDLDIPCNVSVTAARVTIRNVRVTIGGPNAIGIGLRHARDVTIEDSTIRGRNAAAGRMMAGIKDVYGDSTGVRVLYDDISRFETGIRLETGLVRDNYIHDPGYIAGDHTNGVMSNGGVTGLLTINHNTILINRGQTDAIGLFEDDGAQRNRRITDNLLAGGSYAIYAGQKQHGPATSGIVITGNRISTMYYPHGGHYGCAAYFNSRGRQNIWSNNIWNTTSVPSYSSCDQQHAT